LQNELKPFIYKAFKAILTTETQEIKVQTSAFHIQSAVIIRWVR